MRRQVLETMLDVRHVIDPTEQLSDQTLGQIGLLMHSTCKARGELGVKYERTQPLLEMLVGAAGMQVEVRKTILQAHDILAEIGREVIPEVMQGDHGCPKQNFFTTGSAELRVVASSAAA